MTDERMALIELVEKLADGDLVREMLAFAAERIMELEVEARTGAAKGARPPLHEMGWLPPNPDGIVECQKRRLAAKQGGRQP